MESSRNMHAELRTELKIRKQVEDLFCIIDPEYLPEMGVSKHAFLRAVKLDENVRSALLIWPQLKILGQPKTYMDAFKRLDTNNDNYISVDEMSHFIRYNHDKLLNTSLSSTGDNNQGTAVSLDPLPTQTRSKNIKIGVEDLFNLVNINNNGKCLKMHFILEFKPCKKWLSE